MEMGTVPGVCRNHLLHPGSAGCIRSRFVPATSSKEIARKEAISKVPALRHRHLLRDSLCLFHRTAVHANILLYWQRCILRVCEPDHALLRAALAICDRHLFGSPPVCIPRHQFEDYQAIHLQLCVPLHFLRGLCGDHTNIASGILQLDAVGDRQCRLLPISRHDLFGALAYVHSQALPVEFGEACIKRGNGCNCGCHKDAKPHCSIDDAIHSDGDCQWCQYLLVRRVDVRHDCKHRE
mmetsp:Transcript_32758/g.52433  ORF Transcript_32758/g.52433 Transcript_32758/m.52433 type:complete len:238 (+) Transcript_32758:114-827(+)